MEEKKELAEGFLGLVKAMQIKFLPDIIEVKLARSENQAELCYKEYFTYLPKEVQDFVMPISMKAIELLSKTMQVEMKLSRIEQGVEVDFKGPPEVVVAMPLVETLMFGTTNMDKARNLTEAMLKGLQATSSGKVFRNWDASAKNEVEQVMNGLKFVMRLLGVNTTEELMSYLSEEMFVAILQQFR